MSYWTLSYWSWRLGYTLRLYARRIMRPLHRAAAYRGIERSPAITGGGL